MLMLKTSIAAFTIAFIAVVAAKRPPMLTVEQQQQKAGEWAKRVGLPAPPPPVPPKACLSPTCAKQRQAVQQYWEQHLLADLKKSVSKGVQLPLPPSDASDIRVWHRYFGRFADVYQADYPFPPKMSDKKPWRTYWVGMLRFGRHWPSHPPPAKLGADYKKGYSAWAAAFKQCNGALCKAKKGATGVGKKIGRFLKQAGKKVKKALGLQSEHEKEARRAEAARRAASQGSSPPATGMPFHPGMQGGPSSAGYHPSSQGAGQPSHSTGQAGFQHQGAYAGQSHQGGGIVGQGGFGQQTPTGSFPGQSYNPLASRQPAYTGGSGGAGGSVSYNVQRSITYGGGSQGGYYPSPSSPHGQQQQGGYYTAQRSYTAGGGYPQQQPYGQASFGFQRSTSVYNPQQHQQGYGAAQGGSHGATRSMQYTPPRGQYMSPGVSYNVERSVYYSPSQSSIPPRSGSTASYSRQSQQSQFRQSQSGQPGQPVFHGHHATLGPVWRSPASSQALLHGGQRLKYYIERAGMLYEVSAEMFHELRCESGSMKCCAPHCGKPPSAAHPQQAYPPSSQQYGSQYGSGTSRPPYQTSSSQGGTSSTTATTQQHQQQQRSKGSGGGIWSSFANFWNAPATTKQRHPALYGQQPASLYPRQVGGTYGGQYGQQQGAGASYNVSRQVSYSSGPQAGPPPSSASYSANRQYYGSSSQPPSSASYSVNRQVSYGPTTHTTSPASRSSQYSVGRTTTSSYPSASMQGSVTYQHSGGSIGQGARLGGAPLMQQAPPSSAAYGQQQQRAY